MAARSHEDYLALRVLPGLDALRGLSILAVVWHHTTAPIPAVPMTALGFVGVDMFFVLSGFLIVTLLLREHERRGTISLRAFYARRALRIFPLYYGLLAGLALLLWLRPGFSMASGFWDDLPALLTYTSNWWPASGLLMVTWSLAAEEQFYLLWPPLERWLSRARTPLWLVAVALNQLANFGALDPLFPAGHRHADLEILQTTFTPILLGVGLAHLLHRPASYRRLATWLAPRGARAGLLALLLVVLNTSPELAGGPRLALHLLMAALLVSVVTRAGEASPRSPMHARSPLAHLGRVSYGVYLLHLFVRHLLQEPLARSSVRLPGDMFVLCLAGTWLAAALSYRLYERPFLRLKARFARI